MVQKLQQNGSKRSEGPASALFLTSREELMMATPISTPPREMRLADLGELAGTLVHEFNNLLNNCTLYLTILQNKAPQTRDDIESLREQMNQVIAHIRRFQRYRPMDADETGADLAHAVNDAMTWVMEQPLHGSNDCPVELHPGSSAANETSRVLVTLDVASDLPKVSGNENDLVRLCRFLIRNSVRAAAYGKRTVSLRTSHSGQHALLSIEDTGPDVDQGLLARLFEPEVEARQGTCPLEMSACSALARRLDGRIDARARPGGGVAILVKMATLAS